MLQRMASWSPPYEGFRAVLHRPAISLAEVAWRWSFWGAACVLLGFSWIEYLDTLLVSSADELLLPSWQSFLAIRALAHIVQGSGLRFIGAGLLLLAALTVLWILLASVGRAAILESLCDDLHRRARDFAPGPETQVGPGAIDLLDGKPPWRVSSLAGLNFLRTAGALGAFASALGALLLAGQASPGVVMGLVFCVMLLVWLIWLALNWFLSLASVFVVREGSDTFGALSHAASFCRDRFVPIVTVGAWFGLARLILFALVAWAIIFVLAVSHALSAGFVGVGLLLAVLYFVLMDTLSVARLAGYVAILETPEVAGTSHLVFQTEPAPPAIDQSANMVDQDERILSDSPGEA